MKTKFKFKAKDIKYIINDDAIICIIVPDNSLVPREILVAAYQLNNPIEYPPYFKGIARFKDGDTRDVEVGKEIARQKAYRAAFRWYSKTYDRIWHKLVSKLVDMGRYIDNAEAKAKECNDVINNLTKI